MGYLVAVQHTIFHPVSRRDGIHNGRDFDARAARTRKSRHFFHYRRPKIGLKAKARMLDAGRFPAIALWRGNMKELLRQMIVGTPLEPLARKIHAAFARE